MIKIVVWDNISNVLLGVRLNKGWGEDWKDKLKPDDPAATVHGAPHFDELFADYEVNLVEAKTLEEVDQNIADADFLVIHKEHLPGEVLAKGKKLRLVQHLGQDYRGLPMDTVRTMGIPAAATPLINYKAVAEHSWALMLNYFKQLPQYRVHMQERAYQQTGWGPGLPTIKIASDQTLGLLGFGEIARPLARYAQAFEMKTIYWDVRRFAELEADYHIEYVNWDELFSRSDVLSVHIPIMPETHKIIGAREIGLMKPTAFFINTARGKLVDQPALIEALKTHKIAGAGLDVAYEEPIPVDDPLHELHEDLSYNVTLTPHSAWQGPWTWVRDSQEIWFNVLRVLRGEPIHFEV